MGSHVGPHGSESRRTNPSMDRAEPNAPPFDVPLGAQEGSQKEAGEARPKWHLCVRVHTSSEPGYGPETTGDCTCTCAWRKQQSDGAPEVCR